MTTEYLQGFCDHCHSRGLDPEAVIKVAQSLETASGGYILGRPSSVPQAQPQASVAQPVAPIGAAQAVGPRRPLTQPAPAVAPNVATNRPVTANVGQPAFNAQDWASQVAAARTNAPTQMAQLRNRMQAAQAPARF